jgi:hypothetical protein
VGHPRAVSQALLEARLRAVGIAFRSEEELREEGQAKTPDVKLEVPIAVHGRLVHWVDSKASFCDDWTYKTKGLEQFQGCAPQPLLRVAHSLLRSCPQSPPHSLSQGRDLFATPAPPKMDTNCTAPSLVPTGTGNTVRNFPTHGQLSAAQGNLSSCLNFDFAILNLFEPSAP